MLNAKNWKDLQKQLRLLQGKAIFELERHNSLNDGVFLRVLHQVKPHELIFFDGKEKVYLSISEDSEQKMEIFEKVSVLLEKQGKSIGRKRNKIYVNPITVQNNERIKTINKTE